MTTVEEIIKLLSDSRFHVTDEKLLQDELFTILYLKSQHLYVIPEYRLDDKNIIDFLINGSIGVEVKIKGQKRGIFKQCERYCQFDQIKQLILVTNKSMGFPKEINGKGCYVLNLGKAWL